MIETGENLPLVTKAPNHFVIFHAAANQLDRDALVKVRVRTLGQINLTHPTTAQFSNEFIRANSTIDIRISFSLNRWITQMRFDGGCIRLSGEQGLDSGTQCIFAAAGLPKELRASRGFHLQRFFENLIYSRIEVAHYQASYLFIYRPFSHSTS